MTAALTASKYSPLWRVVCTQHLGGQTRVYCSRHKWCYDCSRCSRWDLWEIIRSRDEMVGELRECLTFIRCSFVVLLCSYLCSRRILKSTMLDNRQTTMQIELSKSYQLFSETPEQLFILALSTWCIAKIRNSSGISIDHVINLFFLFEQISNHRDGGFPPKLFDCLRV